MVDAAARRAFVRAHTELVAPPACPELRLHLATMLTPIWQASEAFLHGNNLPPPYWAFAWVGGQALARHLLDAPDLARGRNVLDFAAGCGIASIASARAGAARVQAAEIDPFAAAAIALNAEANGVAVETRLADPIAAPAGEWDLILAGDVCYERPMAERAFAWLRECAAGGALVLLADPGRAYLPKEGLERRASFTIACSRELEGRDEKLVTVYRVLG